MKKANYHEPTYYQVVVETKLKDKFGNYEISTCCCHRHRTIEEALDCLEFLKACGHKGRGWDRAVIHATTGSESKRIKPKPKG